MRFAANKNSFLNYNKCTSDFGNAKASAEADPSLQFN